MKKYGRMIGTGALAFVLTLSVCMVALAGQSEYSASAISATDPNVTFGVDPAPRTVEHIGISCDYPQGMVKFYVWSGTAAEKFAPNTNHVVSTTNIFASHSGALTNGDLAVYQHANGTADKLTVATVTTGQVYFATGISVAGASGDYIYEITQDYQLPAADWTAGNTTNKLVEYSGNVYEIPGGSPLWVTLDCISNSVLGVTVK